MILFFMLAFQPSFKRIEEVDDSNKDGPIISQFFIDYML